jgi:hypothetical protein
MSGLEQAFGALKEVLPESLKKSPLYKLSEYLVIGAMIFGVYSDASSSLATAKEGRNQQLKGYEVQIGYTRTKVEELITQQALDTQAIVELNAENERLRAWIKASSERINRLEDISMRRPR